MVTYDVKCHHCGKRATATMKPAGVAGSYREPRVRMVAQRVVCPSCGFNVVSDEPIPYELWYRVSVRGRVAWACNRPHALFLAAYLGNQLAPREVDPVSVETLPGWMLEPKNRYRVAERLRRMLDGGC